MTFKSRSKNKSSELYRITEQLERDIAKTKYRISIVLKYSDLNDLIEALEQISEPNGAVDQFIDKLKRAPEVKS